MIGSAGVLLVAIAAGYWVLERSANQRGQLRQVGQWLGWFIVIVAAVGTLCRVYSVATGRWGKGMCPFPGMSTTMPADQR